jgi:L-amino acid N-acyltransferase YncA
MAEAIVGKDSGMQIRIARIEDLPAIVAIYNQAVPGKRSTADLEPLRPVDRLTWFNEHTPDRYPIYIAAIDGVIAGWCSLSAYRPGRMALRFTAEISYYIGDDFHRKGVASALISHAIDSCRHLSIKSLLAIVLSRNEASVRLLEKFGYQLWGRLPLIADFDGKECDHLYFGLRIYDEG